LCKKNKEIIMKKIFEVDIENKVYVMAEGIREAVRVARENLEEEVSCGGFLISPIEVTPSSRCAYPWHDAEPYGSVDSKTCGEIFEEMHEAEELRKIRAEADKKQLKLGFYKDVKNS